VLHIAATRDRHPAGGNTDLKKQLGLTIVGPKADAERIPGIDVPLGDGDTWQFGDLEMRVMDTPGHTRGHITLYFPKAAAVFPGEPACVHRRCHRRGCATSGTGVHQICAQL